ncbi:hypothetical protein RB594_000207 [Gaeumannomyces avenae]
MRFSRLVVLALAPLGLAQSAAEPSTTPSVTPPTTNSSTPAAAAPAVPLCAAKCLALGVARSFCATVTPAAEQRKCTCSNQELQLDVATCVAANCTVKESIRFQGVSKANCGVRARDESKSYYVVTIVFAVLAWALVLSRIGFKFFALGVHELCWDDLFIFLTAAITIPSAVITCNGTLANGLGKDIWIVPVEQIYVFLEFFFAMTIFYFVQVGMLKMSLLFFYLRIFPAKPVKRILWATVAVNALVTVLYVILDVIQCSPISLFWTKWDGESNSKCIMEINDLVVSNAVVSIVLDLWMLAVPTWQLRGLQLHWKKKIHRPELRPSRDPHPDGQEPQEPDVRPARDLDLVHHRDYRRHHLRLHADLPHAPRAPLPAPRQHHLARLRLRQPRRRPRRRGRRVRLQLRKGQPQPQHGALGHPRLAQRPRRLRRRRRRR